MTEVVINTRPLRFSAMAAPAPRRSTTAALLSKPGKRAGRETFEFRLIFAFTFVFFLVATALEQLMPWRWLRKRAARSGSIFKKAREMAGTCTTYAFMG